jgi:hypothetical protein
MAAKDKKKKISGVAKLVKIFLKRRSSPKLSGSPPKTAKQQKKLSRRSTAKLKESRKSPISANPVIEKLKIASSKIPEPKKNGRLSRPQSPKLSNRTQNRSQNRTPDRTPDRASQPKKSSLAGPRYFFNTDIPDSYNETYMRAIPRDPKWVFAYWEISESTRKELRAKMGESAAASAKRILRLIDVTEIAYDGSNAQRYIDIEINELANNWYVHVPESGRSYVLELGFLTTAGRFYCATRSNVTGVPRMGVSQLQDEEWATVSTDELIRMSADAMRSGMGSSERRFAAAETLVGHAGLVGGLGSGSGSGGLGDFSSGARF